MLCIFCKNSLITFRMTHVDWVGGLYACTVKCTLMYKYIECMIRGHMTSDFNVCQISQKFIKNFSKIILKFIENLLKIF